MIDPTEHHQMVEDCENRESRMSDWQRGYIDSIKRHLENGRTLSEKQDATLAQVWQEVTAEG